MKTNRKILRKYFDYVQHKRSAILVLSVAVAVVLSLKACIEASAKEPEDPAGITMTTKARELSFVVSGVGDIVIHWGDSKVSNMNDAPSVTDDMGNVYFTFSHVYSGSAVHNIAINGNVTWLDCSGNQLTALDVSRSMTLTDLRCAGNQLTALDVNRNIALIYLAVMDNQLTALDVNKNCALRSLLINRNQLTDLDVSKNTALRDLQITVNQLKNLDLSANTELNTLLVRDNQFSASALNDLFRMLPDVTGKGHCAISISGNPGSDDCDIIIADKKGWTIVYPK